MSTHTNVIALSRVSSAEQQQQGKAGITRQIDANRSTAAAFGLHIVREVEVIESGRHVKYDPQFQQIFRDLKRPDIAGVVVAEQSRIFRPSEFEDYAVLDHFAKNGKLIWVPGALIDPRTAEGRMSLTLNGLMSGEELFRIKGRCMDGKRKMREAGGHPGGAQILPRGVRYVVKRDERDRIVSRHWEHDGKDSELVKQMFQLLLEGENYEAIARKVGHGWSDHGVRCALSNPIWIGRRIYRWEAGEEVIRPGKVKPIRVARLTENPVEVPIDLEPLVSVEVFERAQAMMAERGVRWRKSKLKNTGRAKFLLAGIGWCSKCGKSLYLQYGSRGSHSDRYYCSSKRTAAPCGTTSALRTTVEAGLIELVERRLTDSEFLRNVLPQILDESVRGSTKTLRAERDKAIAKLESRREKLAELYEDGGITREQMRERLRKIENEKQILLSTAEPGEAPTGISPEDLAAEMAEQFYGFKELPFAAQRELLRRMFSSFMVESSEITGVSVRNAGANSRPRSTTRSTINSGQELRIDLRRKAA